MFLQGLTLKQKFVECYNSHNHGILEDLAFRQVSTLIVIQIMDQLIYTKYQAFKCLITSEHCSFWILGCCVKGHKLCAMGNSLIILTNFLMNTKIRQMPMKNMMMGEIVALN